MSKGARCCGGTGAIIWISTCGRKDCCLQTLSTWTARLTDNLHGGKGCGSNALHAAPPACRFLVKTRLRAWSSRHQSRPGLLCCCTRHESDNTGGLPSCVPVPLLNCMALSPTAGQHPRCGKPSVTIARRASPVDRLPMKEPSVAACLQGGCDRYFCKVFLSGAFIKRSVGACPFRQ